MDRLDLGFLCLTGARGLVNEEKKRGECENGRERRRGEREFSLVPFYLTLHLYFFFLVNLVTRAVTWSHDRKVGN